MEMQLACVYMIAIISNSESPRSEKSNIQRKKYWPTHLLLSEGKLLAETFMIEPGILDFSPSN